MNRADLSWALSAVLPHAAKPPRPSFVGIEHHENHLYVYSTDRYTLGIARIECTSDRVISCQLTPKEATELEQFVRPRRVPERVQEAQLVVEGNELHVGGWLDVQCEYESAVFETIAPVLNWQAFLDLTALSLARETQWQSVTVNPAFLARFAKADRDGNIRIEPKQGKKNGSLLVTAGDSFIGLAMQIAYSQPATAVDFPSWPLPPTWNERKAS